MPILILLIVVVICVWLAWMVVDLLQVADPFGRIIKALIVLCGLLVILHRAGLL